ncbi:MAG: hypothetical protein V1790_10160 [Planctomycetota bacterium]
MSIPSRLSTRSSGPKRGGWRAYATIFVVALLVRAAWGATQFIRADDPTILEFPDEEQYWMMARSFWEGEGLKDELGFRATRMPLYPAVLAPFTALPSGIAAAKALHWIVGAAAAALTGAVAGAWFDRRTGLLAGLLVAFDPFLTFSSSLLLTETPFVTALIALWWVLRPEGCPASWGGGRRDAEPVGMVRWIGVGILSALCVYLRESSLGLIVVALGFVIACRRFEGKTLLGAAIALAIVAAALVPWAARNQAVTGDWCWLTHRAGISLYDGVGPNATGASDLGAVKQSEAVRGLDEVAWNRYFLDQALAAIRNDPGRIVRLAGSKLLRMWNPVPNVQVYRSGFVRFLSAAWTVPTFALAAVGVMLLSIGRKRGGLCAALFLLLPALYFSALHSLFVGSVRYRLAAVPMIEILAAVALAAIYRRVQAHGPAHAE